MLPFDLTKALAGHPIQYRNGEVPLEWHYFEKSQAVYPLTTISQNGTEMNHTPKGKRNAHEQHSPFDLFLKEPEMFVNADSEGKSTGRIYRSYEQAKGYLHNDERVFRLVEVTDTK